MKFEKCDILEQKMCKELKALEDKYLSSQTELAIQDLEKIDKLYHALKSMATYNAMKEAEEYNGEDNGMSGRRGRDPVTGRYMSMSGDPMESPQQSYAEGYSRGYSEGQMSGHYPMYHPPYPKNW